MRKFGIRVHIRASPDSVFRVLTDKAHYGDWNPWICSIHGDFVEGKNFYVRTRLWFMLLPVKYRFEKIQDGSLLFRRQIGWTRFFVSSDRERIIYTRADGSAIYATKFRLYGPLSWLAAFLFGRQVAAGIRDEAFALKQYCESFPARRT